MWRLYGWFTGLMMCGSCVGVVTWAAWMQVLVNEYIGNKDPSLSLSQRFFFWSVSDRWSSVFKVTYAIDFLCLSVAKLTVLDRLSDFAVGASLAKHWVTGWRTVLVAVVTANLVGVAGNVAAAVHYYLRADLLMSVSFDLAADNFTIANSKFDQVADELQHALAISSIQAFCEVAVLLLIVLSFAVVGVACARRISSAFSRVDAADVILIAGKQLRRQIVYTTFTIFVTFFTRSVYSTISAIANSLQDFSNISRKCPGTSTCDDICFNVFTHITFWMLRTPEFQLINVLVSKPMPLLVALWGMTTGRMRRGQLDPRETGRRI